MTEGTMLVRQATPADAGAIARLLEEAFIEFVARYTPQALAATVLNEAGIVQRLEQGPVWVAERGASIIGTLAAVPEADGLVLRGMAVRPSSRGLGAGRMLLDCCERFARERALRRLSLDTTRFLEPAIRFYQAAGFRFTGANANPHGVELLRMEKVLSDGVLGGIPNQRRIEQVFREANFVRTLGMELSSFGFGWCETLLTITPALCQQHQFVHAGVLMSLADHTCGGAAASTVPEDKDVITVENKVSFLRPAAGRVLKCRAEVLRSGKHLIFVEAAVTAARQDAPVLVAKASSTLAVIARQDM